jgi:hypothetical protein
MPMNDIENFEPAQLVVDLRDLDLVQKELMDQRHITSSVAERSKELDLALLKLPNLDAEIVALWRDAELVRDAKEDRRNWLKTFRDELKEETATVTLADEDLVVFALRQYFRHEYRGWSPTFDKHHVLDLLEGWPYHKGGIGHPGKVAHVDIPACSGRAGPRVGIADTAIFPHDDLVGRYVGDQVGELPRPAPPTAGHATFIAGLILQRAPDAELVVREVLGVDGVNRSSWAVAVKLMGFLLEDVSVLNMSFGCLVADSLPPLILRRAVERLSRSMVLVAAAGNNGNLPGRNKAGVTARTPSWPAAFDDVVAVGAYDPHDRELLQASFSPHLPLEDLLAPGVRVESTYLSGEVRIYDRNDDTGETQDKNPETFEKPGYAIWDGTSFAAANVSGEIAARMSGSRMSAYEALDDLRENPGDIMPFPLT